MARPTKKSGNGKLIKLPPPDPNRPLPNSQEAEKSVIGGILLSGAHGKDAEAMGRVSPIVEAPDFYHPTHAAIYHAMHNLWDAGRPIDTLTVVEQLRVNFDGGDKLRYVEGEAYLRLLMSEVVTAENIAWHAKIVREKATQRRLIETSQEIAAKGFADYDDVGEYLAEAEKSITALVVQRRQEKPIGISPAAIIDRWCDEGPLVRVPTGIAPLDEACRGGFPVPWRVALVGAPSAGKTMLQVLAAQTFADSGYTVGLLGVDEDPEDLTVRLAQIAGFTVAQAELRDREQLAEMRQALLRLPIRLYGADCSIERAGADLARWASQRGKRAALFVDSVQTAHADCGKGLETERAIVTANIAAIRSVSDGHRMLVIFTSEANRKSYQSTGAAEDTNDLAAGAESRAIEYGAQTQLVLRTPKDHADIIYVKIAKNRRALSGGEFWLKLDRDRHSVEPCPDPDNSPESAKERDEKKQTINRGRVERDAKALCILARSNPGVGTRDLRDRFQAEGLGGNERFRAALSLLSNDGLGGAKLVEREGGGAGKQKRWYLEKVEVANA